MDSYIMVSLSTDFMRYQRALKWFHFEFETNVLSLKNEENASIQIFPNVTFNTKQNYSSSSSSMISLTTVSLICGHPRSENIKFQKKNPWVLNCAPFWVAWWHLASSHPGCQSSLWPVCSHWTRHPPAGHLVAFLIIKVAVDVSQCLCSLPFIGPKHRNSDANNSDIPKRSSKVLLVKWKGVHSIMIYFERGRDHVHITFIPVYCYTIVLFYY